MLAGREYGGWAVATVDSHKLCKGADEPEGSQTETSGAYAYLRSDLYYAMLQSTHHGSTEYEGSRVSHRAAMWTAPVIYPDPGRGPRRGRSGERLLGLVNLHIAYTFVEPLSEILLEVMRWMCKVQAGFEGFRMIDEQRPQDHRQLFHPKPLCLPQT